VCGREGCEDHLDKATSGGERSHGFRTVEDILNEPDPVEVVDGLAVVGRITTLVSESGAGKTFLLLNLAAHVSGDARWHGRGVTHGSVAYVSFEGDAFRTRHEALRDHQGHRLAHLFTLNAAAPLSPNSDRHHGEEPSSGEVALVADLTGLRDELAATGQPPLVLLIVDTVRASLSGSEDHSDTVAAYLRVIRRLLAHIPTAAAILAHHSGWQDGETKRKRERGSSSWRGNSDITLYLEAGEYDRDHGETVLTIRTLKTRDGEIPLPLYLIRRRVELPGLTRYGQPRSSCIIEADRRTWEDRQAELARTAEADHRVADLRVLRVIRDRPEATSQRCIRANVGLGADAVSDSLARLIQAGLVVPPTRQRQPYTVTEAGHAALREASRTSRTE
jgi:hypothetical protein